MSKNQAHKLTTYNIEDYNELSIQEKMFTIGDVSAKTVQVTNNAASGAIS